MTSSSGGFNLYTSDGALASNDPNDLGVEGEGEVWIGLSEGKVGDNWSSAKTVA